MISWLVCGVGFGAGVVVGISVSMIMAKRIILVLLKGLEGGLWDG